MPYFTLLMSRRLRTANCTISCGLLFAVSRECRFVFLSVSQSICALAWSFLNCCCRSECIWFCFCSSCLSWN
jgi:hypothetical protein